MAEVITAITLAQRYQPFEGIDDVHRVVSGIPRGQVIAFVTTDANANIAATGAGDNQRLFATATLPAGYAYAVVEANATVLTIGTNTWLTQGSFLFKDSVVLPDFEIVKDLVSGGNVVLNASPAIRKAYNCEPPNAILAPKLDGSPSDRIEIQIQNTTDQQPEAFFRCYVRCLQFDISQALHFAPNYPIPVR